MTLYNNIVAPVRCPYCGSIEVRDVFAYFGDLSKIPEYKVGDLVNWGNDRPLNGGGEFEGWFWCDQCNKEVKPTIVVENGVIINIETNNHL